MNKPTIDELNRAVSSKYALVVLAAKRARMLTANETNAAEAKLVKPVSIALKEIAEGNVKCQIPSSGLK